MDDIQKLLLDEVRANGKKIDANRDSIEGLKLHFVKSQASCREDCIARTNKLRFSLLKMLALMGASGTLGGIAGKVINLF